MKEWKSHPEVTEVCPHCDSEITLTWDVEKDGYKVFCPKCGKEMMLCGYCPIRDKCDYETDSDGNPCCSMREDPWFLVEVNDTERYRIYVRAKTEDEALDKLFDSSFRDFAPPYAFTKTYTERKEAGFEPAPGIVQLDENILSYGER